MERTLCIIKPDAIRKRIEGNIIQIILDAGFNIIGLKLIKLTKESAERFYEIHREKPFFDGLVKFMTSGPAIVIALEKENAVEDFRNLIGATDPKKAKEGTIRKLYATDVQENAVHGSDSIENGIREVSFFFDETELVK
ncbi:MAG: nucleoside-diphosphate kinase [Ignavibacteria bacterium]|nr:nucleoside-diphosphate kinase [Ignavibacteria bacterium]